MSDTPTERFDEFAEFRGPDGELGTDADYIEDILAAREAAAEYIEEV